MRGQGWEDQVVLCIEGPLHGSFDICEHLSNWWLKRNCRTFHMATLLQAWIKQATSRAGRGGGLSIPGAAEPALWQEEYRKGLFKGFHSQLCPQFPCPELPMQDQGRLGTWAHHLGRWQVTPCLGLSCCSDPRVWSAPAFNG